MKSNPADVRVTQADNNLLVKITEWLIREDAVDEENQKQLNRLGDFLEPLLARHRNAALQQSRSAVEALEVMPEPYEYLNDAQLKTIRPFIDALNNWKHRHRAALSQESADA